MAVWSKVNLRSLDGAMRLDAEYYQPRYLKYERAIRHGDRLGNILQSIMHPIEIKRIYGEEGIQILLAQNIRHNELDFTTKVFMPFSVKKVISRNKLKYGDVVITRSGANYGDAAPYLGVPQEIYACADCLVLRPLEDIDGRYISTYLNSDVGRSMIKRGQYGGAQPHVAPSHIREIRIPRLGKLEAEIGNIVSIAQSKDAESNSLYNKAEERLFSELGLCDVDLRPQLFYQSIYSRTISTRRLDPDFFSPRVQNIIGMLSGRKQSISNFVKLKKRRFKPKPGSAFNYIEIADIGSGGEAHYKEVSGEEAPSRATWIVKSGDVITTTVRPIRRLTAIISEEQDGFVCSSGFAVLRPKDIEPELLLVYLRLPLVAELLDLHTTASMYPAISVADLMKIPFKIPNEKAREAVVEMVQKSFAARDESRRLLEEAKRMVEEAVMEGAR